MDRARSRASYPNRNGAHRHRSLDMHVQGGLVAIHLKVLRIGAHERLQGDCLHGSVQVESVLQMAAQLGDGRTAPEL
eukprot:scaffold7504_cov277-Pinguiococcus_pyrenoidosus.AAC.6